MTKKSNLSITKLKILTITVRETAAERKLTENTEGE